MVALAVGVAAITGGEPRDYLDDLCARCEQPVYALDLGWRVCSSDAGLILAANWCSTACRDRAIHSAVAARLRARRGEL